MLSLSKKSSVVFFAAILAACKPAGESNVKTLDQLTGSNQKNECRGSYSDYFFDLEVGADPALKISEKEKKALSDALKDTYTAIPTLVKISFAGTVGIYLTNNIESRCPDLNRAGLGSREIDACIEATNHSDATQAPFTLYVKAEASAIRNSMLRAFAFFLAEFPGGAPKKWSKDLQQTSPENTKFASLFESQSRELFDAFAEDLKTNGKSFPGIEALASQPADSEARSQFGQLLFAETFDSYFCNALDAGSGNTRKSMQANFPKTTVAFAPLAKIFESMDDQIAQNLQKKGQGFSLAEGASLIDETTSQFALDGRRQQAVVPPSTQPMHTWSNQQLENYVGGLRTMHGDVVIGRGPGDGARRHETLASLRQNADQPRTWTQALTLQRTPANAYRAELQRTALDYQRFEALKYEGRQAGAYGDRNQVYQQSWGNRGNPWLPQQAAAGRVVQDPDNRTFTNAAIAVAPKVASLGAGEITPGKVAKTAWGLYYKSGVKSTGKDISSNGESLYRNSGSWFNPVGLATKGVVATIDRAQINTARAGNDAHSAMVSAMNGNYREPDLPIPVVGVPFSRATGSPASTPRLLGTSPFISSLLNEGPSTSTGRSYQIPLPSTSQRSSSQQPFGGMFSGNRSPSSILTDPFFGRSSGSNGTLQSPTRPSTTINTTPSRPAGSPAPARSPITPGT